jgi:hypothetical protein
MIWTMLVLLARRQRVGGRRARAHEPHVPAVEQRDHVLDEALRCFALGGEPGRAALLDVRGRGQQELRACQQRACNRGDSEVTNGYSTEHVDFVQERVRASYAPDAAASAEQRQGVGDDGGGAKGELKS